MGGDKILDLTAFNLDEENAFDQRIALCFVAV